MEHHRSNIEIAPIARLRPYAQNARTHSRKQITQIADSIRRFGFTNPVLVSDENEIVTGHGRVLAAKQLGMSEVPCCGYRICRLRSVAPMCLPTTSSHSMRAGIRKCWRSNCRRSLTWSSTLPSQASRLPRSI